jgi:hypothetical protein
MKLSKQLKNLCEDVMFPITRKNFHPIINGWISNQALDVSDDISLNQLLKSLAERINNVIWNVVETGSELGDKINSLVDYTVALNITNGNHLEVTYDDEILSDGPLKAWYDNVIAGSLQVEIDRLKPFMEISEGYFKERSIEEDADLEMARSEVDKINDKLKELRLKISKEQKLGKSDTVLGALQKDWKRYQEQIVKVWSAYDSKHGTHYAKTY